MAYLIFEKVYFGMGCFWGAEKYLWELEGVLFTSVGYGDGFTRNPTYEEVCSGQTAHNEIVEVIYDPKKIKFSLLLSIVMIGPLSGNIMSGGVTV